MSEIKKKYRVRESWLNRHLARFMDCTAKVGRYKRGFGMFHFVSASTNGDGTWNVVVSVDQGRRNPLTETTSGGKVARTRLEIYQRGDIRKPLKMLAVENKRAMALA